MFDYVKKVITHFIGKSHEEVRREPRVIPARVHGINPKLVSFAARKTCENLQARGYKAYIVGGAVRDLLLGVTPKDFDVATDATPEQVKRVQRRAYIIGKRFRLVHVVFGQEIIECSTFRALDAAGQRKDASGRVISDNVFGEMWEDAARRDFTINALYYDPTSGDVLDYHDGFEDLGKKRLAMIGDPEERYREDPVRMMRAVRIATKLGFKMESATERAIPKMAANLENVPAARLFDEMMKLFTCGHAEACLIKLRQEGLHRTLLPMLDVILKEKEGEEFLMLALRRTDERIASGKKISPAFLFATLLWPQVLKRWEAYQSRPKMIRSKALYAAADDVIATQCAKLAIQNRFVADMKLIWMLQLRFERRTGKNPYSLIEHVKYRAGYDFMLLRSLLGQIPAEDVRWWEEFVEADEARRREMIALEEQKARRTGDKARAGNARKQEERFVSDTVDRLTIEQLPGRVRRQITKGRKDKNALVEVKSHLPAVSEKKTYLPKTTELSDAERFGDFASQKPDAQAEELVQVETVKSKSKRRRNKKSAAPVVETVVNTDVQVEESPKENVVATPEVEETKLETPVAPVVEKPVVESPVTEDAGEKLVQIESNPKYFAQAEDKVPVKKTKRTSRAKKTAEAKPVEEAAPVEVKTEETAAEAEAPKKRTTRTRKTKVAKTEEAAAPATQATAPAEAQTVEPAAAQVEEKAPETVEAKAEAKPKKRTTRKAKAAAPVVEEAAKPAEDSAQTTPAEPAPKKTRRKTKSEDVAPAAVGEVKAETPVAETTPVETPAPVKKTRARKKPAASEVKDASETQVQTEKPKRRTRTVKKATESAAEKQAVSESAEEPVTIKRRKTTRKASALTHTAPKKA